jgi:hypothetical protein
MQVDWELVRKAQIAATGANIHTVSQFVQTYISNIEAAKIAPIEVAKEFTSVAEKYRQKLEVFVQKARLKSAA